jgi:RNA polymerase sigma-70 factor, ECF subfamily
MEAFDILVEQYRPMVTAYLRTLVNDRDLADDLAQETFLAAYRGIERFDKAADFGAWLRGIARNKALESKRAAARHPLVADSRIIEGMEEVYRALDAPRADAETWSDRLSLLHRCLDRLSGKLREAVAEVYSRQRPLREAAATLHTTFEGVAQRLSRARVFLRKCMLAQLSSGDV